VPDRAHDVTQPGGTQPHGLDGARGRPGIDDVTDAVLVLEDHEHAGQEVLDQVLRAEAEGDPDDAGAGHDRGEVEAELGQDHRTGDGGDGERDDAAQHRAERLGPLAAALGQQRGRLQDPVLERPQYDRDAALDGGLHQASYGPVEQQTHDKCHDDDQHEPCGVRPVGLQGVVHAGGAPSRSMR